MKYVLKNDFDYIRKNKIKLLFFFFFINIVSLIVNMQTEISFLDKIMLANATNLLDGEVSIVQYILLIFNNLVFLFLTLDLFIKNSEMVFFKSNFLIIFTIVMKLLEYFWFLLLLLWFDSISFNTDIFRLIAIDIVYILIIEFIYLALYIAFIGKSGGKILFYLVGIVIFFIIPINVYGLYKHILYIILLLLGIVIFIVLLWKYFHKKLIERIKE